MKSRGEIPKSVGEKASGSLPSNGSSNGFEWMTEPFSSMVYLLKMAIFQHETPPRGRMLLTFTIVDMSLIDMSMFILACSMCHIQG